MFRNWKTTLAGVLLALSTILPTLTKPLDLLKKENLTLLLASAGLIAAKDHDGPPSIV